MFQINEAEAKRSPHSKSPFLWNKRISSLSRQNGASANKIGVTIEQTEGRKAREGKE